MLAPRGTFKHKLEPNFLTNNPTFHEHPILTRIDEEEYVKNKSVGVRSKPMRSVAPDIRRVVWELQRFGADVGPVECIEKLFRVSNCRHLPYSISCNVQLFSDTSQNRFT